MGLVGRTGLLDRAGCSLDRMSLWDPDWAVGPNWAAARRTGPRLVGPWTLSGLGRGYLDWAAGIQTGLLLVLKRAEPLEESKKKKGNGPG
ncbi:hypothetical protein CDL15_Pgr021249 [Punica granatum]|uniref:Uncharacterized protein n=1 Tax=Punica granatum TaxID=22663 RepID=A0A218WQZ8_PUNGR|nr:hypothetical protein CDL15_Pgr021249 [Punica granatum]PKI68349.1 hypothetical protein CRG98_011257 [Punica granatum]